MRVRSRNGTRYAPIARQLFSNLSHPSTSWKQYNLSRSVDHHYSTRSRRNVLRYDGDFERDNHYISIEVRGRL